jgi:hypothetical protein
MSYQRSSKTYFPVAEASARRTVAQNVLVPVATRNNNGYLGLVGSSTTQTYRTCHYTPVDITSLEVWYGNSYDNSGVGTDGPGALTVSFSIEPVIGAGLYRGFFGAAHTGTVNPGAVLKSDSVGVFIPKGTYFYIRTYVSGNYPVGIQCNTLKGLGGDSTGNSTFTTDSFEGIASPSGTDVTASGNINSSYSQAYSPIAIIGTTRTPMPVWIGIGDSILNCTNDLIDTGYLWRAIANQWPLAKLSYSGENAYQWAVSNSATPAMTEARKRLVRLGTHFVFNYGRNDLTNSRTLAQIQADLITCWAPITVQNGVAYQTTITPSSTSTDQFATLTNQTAAASESVRLTLNAWFRDGAPMIGSAPQAVGTTGGTVARCTVYNAAGSVATAASGPAHYLLGGILEVADVVESARNSGKWNITNVRTVSDAAMSTGATPKVLTSATANFTNADLGKSVYVAGAGTAGATINGIITAVTNSTTITVTPSCITTVTGAALQIGSATVDGVHPDGYWHRQIGAAIAPILTAASAAYLASGV